MKSNDFDRIAKMYDWIARLVFGKSIIVSQKYFLSYIPDRSKVLILGGGTGWILKELLQIKPNVHVYYIEASSKMISMAKNKIRNSNSQVDFVHGTEQNIPLYMQFDFVITHFYLDLFPEEALHWVVPKIKKSLKPTAKWMATDFVQQTWWHSLLVRAMYFFFRFTCNLSAKKLPRWNKTMLKYGAKKNESKFFYRNFIEAILYQF